MDAMERAKRRARMVLAFKELHDRYGQPIKRLCPGCGCEVDHHGPMIDRVTPCQICQMFQGYPRRG